MFLLSLFGTNMTAFTILGSAGHAFTNGIVTFGLMASASAFVIPLRLFFVGTRIWALGKRHGFMTPVQMFRDRWECGHIGTVIFARAGGAARALHHHRRDGRRFRASRHQRRLRAYWLGGAVVALVVMSYVFFGGMRGTAWVNTFQTLLFLSFGAVALVVIGRGMGGFSAAMESLLASPATAPLLTRERIPPWYFFSYTFIPLSTIAFPHITIFCLTAKRMEQFRRTVIFYPLCILAIWLPCVFLGVAANAMPDVPRIASKLEARAELAAAPASMPAGPARRDAPAGRGRRRGADHAGAVRAAVAGGDPRCRDHGRRDGERLANPRAVDDVHRRRVRVLRGEGQVRRGRAGADRPGVRRDLTVLAYLIALRAPQSIFDLAVQYAFSGYSALSVLLFAALFWKRSTKWGALAVTLWTASAVIYTARIPGALTWFGLTPVVHMTLMSAVLMVIVSLATRPPSRETLAK